MPGESVANVTRGGVQRSAPVSRRHPHIRCPFWARPVVGARGYSGCQHGSHSLVCVCVCVCVLCVRACCACVWHVCVVLVGRAGGAASVVCLVDVPVSVLSRVFALCAFMRVSCACTCVHLYVIHGRCTTCWWLIDLGQVVCEFQLELPHFAGCNLGTWILFALLVYLTRWQRLAMVSVRSFFTVGVHAVRCVGSKRTRVFLCIGHAMHRVSWLAVVQPWTHLDRIRCLWT